ncbi:helix-turn-helix transcriptional regulator [Burkholderia stagnalis]|uniref:helix-turn-helix transcriptional regulator n=1 Tax=Burkholderia stagnalis TaxID=1503054 RepID=UPI002AB3B574|nr:helix-turn-helix transcriptional regulator [Burkholderia stagnalis]MDY7807576.1 helix-turn-helix transcriptional regulator [Burkholderia stagnalis]
MKPTNDTAEMARRITQALDELPLPLAEVAAACGVSPQAVNGWKRTGRIGKDQLPKLAQLTGRPLSWWLGIEETESAESPRDAAIEKLIRVVGGRSAAEVEAIADALDALLRLGSGSTDLRKSEFVIPRPGKKGSRAA